MTSKSIFLNLLVYSTVTLVWCTTSIRDLEFQAASKQQDLLTDVSIIDPDRDCEIRFHDQKVTIEVPNVSHNLHSTYGVNAPRILQRVAGDFQAQVKVTSDFAPGENPTAGQGIPFVSAGILIWESDKTYLRVERNAYWRNGQLRCFPPLIEYQLDEIDQGLRPAFVPAEDFSSEKSTWLRLERKGQTMTVSISHDGEEWQKIKSFDTKFPNEVRLGVVAINTSDKPFVVDFEDFAISKSESK